MRELFKETQVPRLVGGSLEKQLWVTFKAVNGLEKLAKAFKLHSKQVVGHHPWRRDPRTNERIVDTVRQDLQGNDVYVRVSGGDNRYMLSVRGASPTVEAIVEFIKRIAKTESERTIQLMELESRRLPKENTMRARSYVLEGASEKQIKLDLTTFNSAASFKKIVDKFKLKPSVETKAHPFLKDQPTRKIFWWKGPGLAIATTNNPITGEYTVASQRENEKGYAGYVTIEGDPDKVKAAMAMVKKLASIKGRL